MTPIEKYEEERARFQAMTLKDAEAELSNAVYAATSLLERLEGVGRLVGNGHHARQKIAQMAVEELRSRWQEPAVHRGAL